MTCPCGNPASYRCAWKLRRPFAIWAKDLKEGDKMQLPGGLTYNPIHRITPGKTIGWVGIVFSFAPDSVPHPVFGGWQVSVIRPGYCDAPICDACCREVADGRNYCRAHWAAHERQGEFDQSLEVVECS